MKLGINMWERKEYNFVKYFCTWYAWIQWHGNGVVKGVKPPPGSNICLFVTLSTVVLLGFKFGEKKERQKLLSKYKLQQ